LRRRGRTYVGREMPERTIVVGLDGSENSSRALRWAIDSAQLTGGDIHAVHALQPFLPETSPGIPTELLSDARATLRERASDELEAWVRPVREAGVPYRSSVAEGSAAAAMMQIAMVERARMIVVGRRGLSVFATAFLGSVSHRLVQQSTTPVVVVPEPQEGYGGVPAEP
jgi:nucleotide-binding universal stress UspA family protein